MNRKIKIIILVLVGLFMLTSSSTKKKVNVPYSIKCYKCWENKMPYTNMGVRSIANRSFKDEYTGRKMEGYCVYRCQHGHILYVNYDTGDRQ